MNPRTVEDVLKDFRGRRAGIIKALTKDVEEFYKLRDPNNSNLCLYGFPNKQWEVNLPPPSDLPEPRLGINFVRDSMKKHEWLSMVALHSDAWLYAIASYFAAKFKFDKSDRKRLFSKIVDVPSICESMQGSAMKRVKAEGGGLPEELVEGILARLPVRDLLKYRSVCRMWLSLVDHPDFVSTHLEKYKNNSESTNLLILYRPAKNEFTYEKVSVRRADTYRKVMDLESLVDHHRQISYVHVDGLILIKKGISREFCEIILWNPSINRSLNVPNCVFEAMRTATYVELGLGYDASCNDYKVIAIIYPQAEIKYGVRNRYRAFMPGLVQVYKLSTNSWSTNLGVGIGVSPPPYWSVGKQVFINGAIHWINFGPNHVKDDTWFKTKESYIVSFDVEKEDFNYFELPRGLISDAEPKEKFPTDFRGLFAIFCAYNDQYRNDIWVMGEYGVPDSWSKSYTFTLQFDKLLHFKSNGEVLFAVN